MGCCGSKGAAGGAATDNGVELKPTQDIQEQPATNNDPNNENAGFDNDGNYRGAPSSPSIMSSTTTAPQDNNNSNGSGGDGRGGGNEGNSAGNNKKNKKSDNKSNNSHDGSSSSSWRPPPPPLQHDGSDWRDRYDIVELVKEGDISDVYQVRKKPPYSSAGSGNKQDVGPTHPDVQYDVIYILKEIDLARVKPELKTSMMDEVDRIVNMQHRVLSRAYEVYKDYDDHQHVAILLDYSAGGSCTEHMLYTERQTAQIIRQVLEALDYMHGRGVYHRDLHVGNVMFKENKTCDAKIIDFGLPEKFRQGQSLVPRYQRIYYMSPQVVSRDGDEHEYTRKDDIWSAGILTCVLLSGEKPFWGPNEAAIEKRVQAKYFDFLNGPVWEHVSEDGREFVMGLLQYKPSKRMTVQQALAHPWLLLGNLQEEEHIVHLKEEVEQEDSPNEFRRLAIQMIAASASSEDILELGKVCRNRDKTKVGFMEYKQLRTILEEDEDNKYHEDHIEHMFWHLQVDQQSFIKYTTLLLQTLQAHVRVEQRRVAQAVFQLSSDDYLDGGAAEREDDDDDDGCIPLVKLHPLLGEQSIKDDVIFNLVDEAYTGDGKIKYKDLIRALEEKLVVDTEKLKKNMEIQ